MRWGLKHILYPVVGVQKEGWPIPGNAIMLQDVSAELRKDTNQYSREVRCLDDIQSSYVGHSLWQSSLRLFALPQYLVDVRNVGVF